MHCDPAGQFVLNYPKCQLVNAKVTEVLGKIPRGWSDAFRDNQTAHSNAQLSMLHGLIAGYPKIGVPLHHLVLG